VLMAGSGAAEVAAHQRPPPVEVKHRNSQAARRET